MAWPALLCIFFLCLAGGFNLKAFLGVAALNWALFGRFPFDCADRNGVA